MIDAFLEWLRVYGPVLNLAVTVASAISFVAAYFLYRRASGRR